MFGSNDQFQQQMTATYFDKSTMIEDNYVLLQTYKTNTDTRWSPLRRVVQLHKYAL